MAQKGTRQDLLGWVYSSSEFAEAAGNTVWLNGNRFGPGAHETIRAYLFK
jgi:hypothetical protein